MKNPDNVVSFLEREKGPHSLDMLNLTLFERTKNGISIYDISREAEMFSVSTFKNIKISEEFKKKEIIKMKPSDIEDFILEKNLIRTKRIKKSKNIENLPERLGINILPDLRIQKIKGIEYFQELKNFLLSKDEFKVIVY